MKKSKVKTVSEKQMAQMMDGLIPISTGTKYMPRPYTFDFGGSTPGSDGLCLSHRGYKGKLKKTYREYAKLRNIPVDDVWGLVVGWEVDVLVVDPTVAAIDGWRDFMLTAIHEYAHHVRGVFEDSYPRLKDEHDDQSLTSTFYDMNFLPIKSKRQPLFGDWSVRTAQVDLNAHDPLFYFLLYFLERKADDMGFLDMRVAPKVTKGKWLGHYFEELKTKRARADAEIEKNRKEREGGSAHGRL